jgi:hypothetical protein
VLAVSQRFGPQSRASITAVFWQESATLLPGCILLSWEASNATIYDVHWRVQNVSGALSNISLMRGPI